MYCFGLSSHHSPLYATSFKLKRSASNPDLALSMVCSLANVFSDGHMTQANPTGLNLGSLIVTNKKKKLAFREVAKLQGWESTATRNNPIPTRNEPVNSEEKRAETQGQIHDNNLWVPGPSHA